METLPNGSVNNAELNQENEKSMYASESEEARDIFVYREDVVSLKSKEDVRGVVLEVAGEYDYDGSITDDDIDTEEHEDKTAYGAENGVADGGNVSNGAEVESQSSLPDNKVRVLWIDGSEKTEDIDEVVVVDRSFLHGDFIASASDPTGQMGLVLDVNLVVDLQGANGDMIKGVSSKELGRIREFNVGDYVVSGLWLGRVDGVLDNVYVSFDDGSVCKVNRADPKCLKPAAGPIHPDTACPFYPGQRVKASSSSVFKTCRWLNGFWRASRLEGTITKVESVAVLVYWIASAHFATDQQSVPLEEQNPEDLTLLSRFSYTNWQLTDWCFSQRYTSCTNDTMINSDKHTGQICTCSENSVPLSGIPESQADAQIDTDTCHRQTDVDSTADGLSMSDGDNSCIAKESETGTSASSISNEGPQDNATSRKKFRKLFFKKDKRTKKRDDNFERALLIANTCTKVDVIWQDGTKECGVAATALIPIHSPNEHEFFPEQYVVDKVTNDVGVDDSSEPRRVGLVRGVNAKDRTATVSWFKPPLHPEEPKEIACNEIVSVYELDVHPDYDYCYGDIVVRLPPVKPVIESTNSKEQMELDKTLDSSEGFAASYSAPPDTSADEQLSQKESCLQFTSLSWAGNIVGFQDGEIEVIWGDGSISKVGPHEIYVVGREDDGASLDDGTASDGSSWETVDDNEMDVLHDSAKGDSQNVPENSIGRENGSFSSQDGSSVATGPLSVAFEFVTRLASDLFARGRRHLDGSSDAMDEVESHWSNEISEIGDDIDKCNKNHVESPEHAAVIENDSSVEKSVDVVMADNPVHSECFKHFDVLQCPLDHHYLENTTQGTGGKKWVKKVQQEWSILEKNLPDYIYVRVFEDRMDLLRAVIVGASGTPYQDGLFFFDFHLPLEYPLVPPSAYYHSGGLRVNPNLYVDGKHFEDFVKSHFRKRGHYILKACHAYLQGNVVGTLTDDACTTDRSKEHSSSVGFKLVLAKILPRLITALKDTGADCDQYEHLGRTETVTES
ncbi:putative ubiquitin-conjugating enzyme E2 23 [Zea mays]|uniref:Putative ubiquitin-conjugating enzyme E2 23 n=1 Tax=Zea mays TaxID=4577 RepID=A0A3L6FNG7_MAIZE|nr:hypothetical protein Zm00014a_044321 [Zea mays]PWZ34690.1 putative ubiquitin-conjugating enzyme E2 23 [Zea mays]